MRPLHQPHRNGDTTVNTLVGLGVLLIVAIGGWVFTQFRHTRELLKQERARADEAVVQAEKANVAAIAARDHSLRLQLRVDSLESMIDAKNLQLEHARGFKYVFLDETSAELIGKGRGALKEGEVDKALTYFNRAVEVDPKSSEVYSERGRALEILCEHRKAIEDFSRSLLLDPKNVEALNHRGSERFKLGQIKESVADFDAYVKAKPAEFNGHWKRGIALYYAGRFDDGRKQFEGYEKVDTNDVENAVWHFLCVARKDGVEKARAALLKIGRDRRVPMMEVYDLFAGKITPEKVLEAVERDKPNEAEQKRRMFYAHLYLGLYCEVTNDSKKALEHLTKAADLPKPHHFMWDVARVHRDLLKKK